jgi:hypothetical protein
MQLIELAAKSRVDARQALAGGGRRQGANRQFSSPERLKIIVYGIDIRCG